MGSTDRILRYEKEFAADGEIRVIKVIKVINVVESNISNKNIMTEGR